MNFSVFCFCVIAFLFQIQIQMCNAQSTKYLYSDEMTQKLPEYSMGEVRKHNNENDAWLVIDGYIYNVTKFVSHHPGGNVIYHGLGKDATHLFDIWHCGKNSTARNILPSYLIGKIKKYNYDIVCQLFPFIILGLYVFSQIINSEMFKDFYESLYKRHFKHDRIDSEKLN
jgi:cytochrome b involved in lipid metabolism